MSGSNGANGVTLFIDPFSRHFLEDRLFEHVGGALGAQDIHAPWIFLRSWFEERGVDVFTADRLLRGERENEHNVYLSFGIEENARALASRGDVTMTALFLFEGPIVEPRLYSELANVQDCFKRVYSFSDERSLAPFLMRPVELQPFCLPSPVDGIHERVWANRDRKFLVMINGNRRPRVYLDELYTERLRALEFFGRTADIDLYGFGWNDPPYRSGKTWMPYTLQRIARKGIVVKERFKPDPLLESARRVYHGPTMAKIETLGEYAFAVCYENQILRGWITEKIFDCFGAGTVPVYWGAPDIDRYVPPETFIDRRMFASYEELRQFLKTVGPDEVQSYREAARDYLDSEAFYPFSKEAFVDRCVRLIEEDTGIRVR